MPLSRPVPALRTAALAAVAAVATLALTAVLDPSVASAAPTPTAGDPAKVATPGPGAAPVATPGERAAAGSDLTFGLRRGQSLVRKGSSATLPSTIVSFDLPPAGTTRPLGGYGTYLVLQSDGNLVEYEATTGRVLFAAGNRAGAKFVYQSDGNAVLYSATGQALFATGTSGDRVGQFLLAYGNGQLLVQSDAGQIVTSFGSAVTPLPGVVTRFADSPNGRYELLVQSDGNVVVRDVRTGRAIWNTGTGGRGRARFAVQSDGNLVLYAYPSNTVLWYSHSHQSGSAYYQLDVKNSGNVVLYRTNGRVRTGQVWQSHSGQ